MVMSGCVDEGAKADVTGALTLLSGLALMMVCHQKPDPQVSHSFAGQLQAQVLWVVQLLAPAPGPGAAFAVAWDRSYR